MGNRPQATAARSADENLEALVAAFRDAAQALDPSITKCWIGYDELMDGPRDMRVMSIYLEREHKRFVQVRAKAA